MSLSTPPMRRTLLLEPRVDLSPWTAAAMRVGSVLVALLASAVLLEATGSDALKVYATLWDGAFGSVFGFTETLVRTIPLLLCGLGVALAFRMLLWNIGAEGQFHMGAFAAAGIALSFGDWPAWLLLPAMAIAAMLAGGAWCLLPALARAYLSTNEVITSLLLNYVAINWILYLVYGPWKDPYGFNFPFSPEFSENAMIPPLIGRVHAGLLVALLMAVLIHVILQRTRWGYEIRVVGESATAARYAGIPIVRNIVLVMFVSGALAGLAGMMEVSGVIGRLQRDISPGYGYTAIIVAYLARLHPLALVLAAFLFGGLQAGGYSLQILGVPLASVYMIQGSILFFVLAGEALSQYRIRWVGAPAPSSSPAVGSPAAALSSPGFQAPETESGRVGSQSE